MKIFNVDIEKGIIDKICLENRNELMVGEKVRKYSFEACCFKIPIINGNVVLKNVKSSGERCLVIVKNINISRPDFHSDIFLDKSGKKIIWNASIFLGAKTALILLDKGGNFFYGGFFRDDRRNNFITRYYLWDGSELKVS